MDDDLLLRALFPPSALPETPEDAAAPGERRVWRVAELHHAVQGALDAAFPPVWVEGEVSNLRAPASGHLYFTLKDEAASLRCVLFRAQGARLAFRPEDGRHILCLGRLNVYPARGDLQLVVEYAEPAGEGALRLAFEQLKRRLAAEGLFDEARKRPLPAFPDRVFLVTSPTGAAFHDFVRTARARFRPARIVLVPSRVQGAEAPGDLRRALELAGEAARPGDVVVLARGGGSIEDLWAFNSEEVARAVAACPVPVVSAVGHEIDFTIADFAADRRAATPTAAAEAVFPEAAQWRRRLTDLQKHLAGAAARRLAAAGRGLDALKGRLRDPRRRLLEHRLALDRARARLREAARVRLSAASDRLARARRRLEATDPSGRVREARVALRGLALRLPRALAVALAARRRRLEDLAAHLEAVSPLAVLGRGYSLVVRLPEETLVRDAAGVAPGDRLRIRPQRGQILAKVLETSDKDPGETP
ncbi:exodeoxyribonuclease VII large subunit [Dissulfurirhabdus thermomarina]|uniref:Exodeoxyribonuclease 7 large subunit n=1 Tax=Dissulfurirhabdus thermomarina TaxID=1765737 RepID=A0A6N9TLS0_DISTH|nr:exodeoxyribonuclease VII large subunit [Dissulfurirhabdus thermomarina]NDY42069.1 exodeoxyribonuclease VII large subunit [Dissulfurirhabdus thermomarina]NMX24504.1 exodeoxyribonuclease VII large subunit [Dissulfurirhabdus thermomarina]